MHLLRDTRSTNLCSGAPNTLVYGEPIDSVQSVQRWKFIIGFRSLSFFNFCAHWHNRHMHRMPSRVGALNTFDFAKYTQLHIRTIARERKMKWNTSWLSCWRIYLSPFDCWLVCVCALCVRLRSCSCCRTLYVQCDVRAISANDCLSFNIALENV